MNIYYLFPDDLLIHKIDLFMASKLSEDDYFVIDYSSCQNDEERKEVIWFYISRTTVFETPYHHVVDEGYKKLPDGFSIAVEDYGEMNCTYKRYWECGSITDKSNGVTFPGSILWHLHDGASDCYDECWISV